ncbi:hypothetical protein SAMN04515665_12133 [Blastococcus sp. DSM 46786]|nr:hypothetical protein SAMN04515665_12133 [Blastococcus sp. DSM 46786]
MGDSVYIEHDYFWSVPADELYNIDQPPGDLTLGQLSECLQQIESLVNEPDDVIAYHMVWLGELLKAVGHKVVG